MAATPDFVRLTMFSWVSLQSKQGLGDLIDLLAEHNLTPTHTGSDERAKGKFDRDALIDKVTAADKGVMVVLVKKKEPAYYAHFFAKRKGLTKLMVEWKPAPPELVDAFRLGEDLATLFRAEFGMVQPMFRGHDDFNRYGIMEVDWLTRNGPSGVAARNFYGAYMTKAIGMDRLKKSKAALRELKYGGVELDLVTDPWTANLETLKRRQKETMAALAPSGIFGDYSNSPFFKPAPNWKPIPEPAK
jgi:hypothetical protein